MDKKLIQIKDVPYLYLEFDILEGTLEEVSKKVLSIRQMLKEAYERRQEEASKHFRKDMLPNYTPFKQYEQINLSMDYNYGDEKEINITVWRNETDEELKQRIELNKKKSESAKVAAQTRKEAVKKRELTLLKTLQEKYKNQ